MFWGPAKLLRKLGDEKRVEPFHKDRIDGASYRLSIGKEVYVSPTVDATDASTRSITRLKAGEAFAIPPGQFAILLTDECVRVCRKELALISIRARTKYRGLVNASGFHVDPGFSGHLTFAVYNAGPVSVHLRRGQEIFLLWYADLSDACDNDREPNPNHIASDLVSGISGKLHSLASLSSAVSSVEQKLERRLDSVTRELAIFRVVAAIGVTLLISIGGVVLRGLGQ